MRSIAIGSTSHRVAFTVARTSLTIYVKYQITLTLVMEGLLAISGAHIEDA